MLANDFLYADPWNLVIFPDNHDIDRFYTQVNEDPDLFKIGLVYFLTMRGIPQFLYGTEIMMTNSVRGDHGLIRSDFPGGWATDQVNGFTGAGLSETQRETKEFMRKLLIWRKECKIIHHGKLMHYSPSDGLYVYFRHDNSGKVMVVLNKNPDAIRFNPDLYPEMLGLSATGTDVITGQTIQFANWTVPAKSPAVIEIK
jgi:glycosidase